METWLFSRVFLCLGGEGVFVAQDEGAIDGKGCQLRKTDSISENHHSISEKPPPISLLELLQSPRDPS